MADGRLAKDVQYLCKHVGAYSNGQARVTEVDDTLRYVTLDILPNEGFYRGAKIRFRLEFAQDGYPDEVPRVLCLDKVLHPNISPPYSDDPEYDEDCENDTNICVTLLEEWETSMGLDHIVMAILFLFHSPNPEDPLHTYDGFSHCDDYTEKNVRRSLRGGTVSGNDFPRLLINSVDDDEDDEVNDETNEDAKKTKEVNENVPGAELTNSGVGENCEVAMDTSDGACTKDSVANTAETGVEQTPIIDTKTHTDNDRPETAMETDDVPTRTEQNASHAEQLAQKHTDTENNSRPVTCLFGLSKRSESVDARVFVSGETDGAGAAEPYCGYQRAMLTKFKSMFTSTFTPHPQTVDNSAAAAAASGAGSEVDWTVTPLKRRPNTFAFGDVFCCKSRMGALFSTVPQTTDFFQTRPVNLNSDSGMKECDVE